MHTRGSFHGFRGLVWVIPWFRGWVISWFQGIGIAVSGVYTHFRRGVYNHILYRRLNRSIEKLGRTLSSLNTAAEYFNQHSDTKEYRFQMKNTV